MGWLLRVNRLCGPQEQWQRGASFATVFQGGCWPEHTTTYRISRWETAVVRAPYLAVRRYEELLELPANHLVALIDSIYRYRAPTIESAPLLRRTAEIVLSEGARLDELLQAARTAETMTGSDWDELTALLAAAPGMVITPRSAWTEIAERLLAEMVIADGMAWLQRYEALNRLLAHPTGQPAAVAACASLAADRTNQVFVETVSVLDASAHPDASRHVVEQLAHPTNGQAQYGALLACVRKLRYGHFTEPQLRRLVPVVGGILVDDVRDADFRSLAAEVLRRVPDHVATAVGFRRRRSAHREETGPHLPYASEASDALVERVANTTVATTAAEELPFSDILLPVFIEEMLFHPVFDVRLYAATLLLGTPYRRALAAALATELSRCVAARDSHVSCMLVEALRILGGPEQRPVIERLTTAMGIAPSLTVAATSAIGHVGGSSDDRYWATALNHHMQVWQRARNETSAAALKGLIYGLGLARNDTLLHRVRDGQDMPATVRAAAAWWLNLPRTVYESASR